MFCSLIALNQCSEMARFRHQELDLTENIKCNVIRDASMLIDYDNTKFTEGELRLL